MGENGILLLAVTWVDGTAAWANDQTYSDIAWWVSTRLATDSADHCPRAKPIDIDFIASALKRPVGIEQHVLFLTPGDLCLLLKRAGVDVRAAILAHGAYATFQVVWPTELREGCVQIRTLCTEPSDKVVENLTWRDMSRAEVDACPPWRIEPTHCNARFMPRADKPYTSSE